MKTQLSRRTFLKSSSAAASALAYAVTSDVGAHAVHPDHQTTSAAAGTRATATSKTVRISSVAYTPGPDYAIQATRVSHVTLQDNYWKPRVDTNATVTIPLLVQRQLEDGRGFNGNILEAAILSLAAR